MGTLQRVSLESDLILEDKESLVELLKQEETLTEYSKLLSDLELTCRGLATSMCQGQGVINTVDTLIIKLQKTNHN